MANRITDKPMTVAPRHGRAGDTQLKADIPLELRARLVQYCRDNEVTIRYAVNAALEGFLRDRGR